MSRNHIKAASTKLGVREQSSFRTPFDKSKPIKELAKKVGNKSPVSPWTKATGYFPSTQSKPPQLSAVKRHSVRTDGAVTYVRVSQVGLMARAHRQGSPSETPMKNEFRAELIALPSANFEFGAKGRAVIPRLIPLVRALFLEGRCLDVCSLSNAIFPNSPIGIQDTTFYQEYAGLVAARRILTAQNGKAGAGQSPYAFDLCREHPFTVTGSLQTLLSKYQSSDASGSARRAALAAARVLLDLSAHSSTDIVLATSKQIPFDALHGLADRFAANARIAGMLNPKTIANLTSALRALITFGLREDLFPLYFPVLRPIDAWSDLVDTAFPLAATGRTDNQVLRARCGLFTLFAEARDSLRVPHPSELSVIHINKAMSHLSTVPRRGDRQQVAGLMKVRNRANGDWQNPVIRLVIETLETQRVIRGVPYLKHKDNALAPISTLPEFLEGLKSHGFHDEWRTFFTWYIEYSSLDWRDIDAREGDYPSRRRKRKLSADTFESRLRAARAYLGVAERAFPETYAQLSPQEVFGGMYRPLTRLLYTNWELAAKLPNSVSHRASAGLHQIICGGGMISRALFDLAVHQSRAAAKGDAVAPILNGSHIDRERINPDRSDVERSLLDAYEYSGTVCENLLTERCKSAAGSGKNTVKDLRKAIRETPFWKFQKAQHELLSRVRNHIDDGSSLSRSALKLTVATLVHGILLSGGCRRGELCHLREGIHTNIRNGSREVLLRAADRKNEKVHEFALRDRWLPDWFLHHYLENVRPEIATHDVTTDPKHFLVMNPNTKQPYGCSEENAEDGSNRDTKRFRGRKRNAVLLWQQHVASAFIALGYAIPVGQQQFGMHIVRNVGGHAVFVTKGIEAAAHFLGDRVGSVEGVYAALKGELVDTSLLEDQ